jgi:iron complex outermembrane receptor protein
VNAADPVNHPENGMIPSSGVINLNVSWENLAGMPIDASFFMSNVTNKVTYLQVNDSTTRGFVTALLGEPRMWGFRLKYRFGN